MGVLPPRVFMNQPIKNWFRGTLHICHPPKAPCRCAVHADVLRLLTIALVKPPVRGARVVLFLYFGRLACQQLSALPSTWSSLVKQTSGPLIRQMKERGAQHKHLCSRVLLAESSAFRGENDDELIPRIWLSDRPTEPSKVLPGQANLSSRGPAGFNKGLSMYTPSPTQLLELVGGFTEVL